MPDSTKGNKEKFDKTAEFYKNRYGSMEGLKQTLSNDPIGAVMDASTLLSLGSSAIRPIAKAGKAKVAEQVANAEAKALANAPKAEILAEAIKKGFVMPPSDVNPSFWNKRLESIGGKAAVRQEATLRNQENFVNPLTRKALGIAENTPIKGDVLRGIRENAGGVYKEVSELPAPPSLANGYSINSKPQSLSSIDLEALKQARNDAQAWRKTAEMQGGNPEIMAKAREAENTATMLEKRFEDRAAASGKPELIDRLRDARTEIAKTHTVDSARNVATGDIDPAILGRILDKNPELLSGELKQIAETQQAFPKYLSDATKVQTPGVSKSEALASAIMAGQAVPSVGASGLLAGGVPLVSEPIRNLIFSKGYQNKMVKFPEIKPSVMAKLQAALPDSQMPIEMAIANALYQMNKGEQK